jgi:hypothetical protein
MANLGNAQNKLLSLSLDNTSTPRYILFYLLLKLCVTKVLRSRVISRHIRSLRGSGSGFGSICSTQNAKISKIKKSRHQCFPIFKSLTIGKHEKYKYCCRSCCFVKYNVIYKTYKKPEPVSEPKCNPGGGYKTKQKAVDFFKNVVYTSNESFFLRNVNTKKEFCKMYFSNSVFNIYHSLINKNCQRFMLLEFHQRRYFLSSELRNLNKFTLYRILKTISTVFTLAQLQN